MVVEICSENCGVTMSPRISFSHDFSQLDVIPVEKHPLRSNSSGLNSNTSIDFDFCVQQESLDNESSSADELFSDGRILPIEIKNNFNNNNKNKNGPLNQKGLQHQEAITQPPLPPLTRKNSRRESTKEKKELMNDEVDDQKQGSNSNSKSFWRFKRSSSCGNGYGRSLCPLPLLSRSNSTGSSPSVKRVPTISSSKDGPNYNIKQNSQKNCYSHTTSSTRSSSSSSSSHSFGPNNHQIRPPLKKSHGPYGSNNNSVRVNPVLNVPPVNLFGLGSIFSNSREKCRKK